MGLEVAQRVPGLHNTKPSLSHSPEVYYCTAGCRKESDMAALFKKRVWVVVWVEACHG